MNSHKKRFWSRGDRLLLSLSTLTVAALILGLAVWFRALDALPGPASPAPLPLPAVNARDFYLAAANAAAATGSFGEDSQAVRLLHQGFQYPYREPPAASQLPLQEDWQVPPQMLSLGMLLGRRARADAQAGRWASSVSAGTDAVQMGREMMHGATAFGVINIRVFQQRGTGVLWGDIDHLTADQARAAARRMEAAHADRVPFADTLTQEKWSMQAGLREEMRRPNWRDIWAYPSRPPLKDARGWARDVAGTARVHLTSKRQILADNTRYMDRLIADARRPYAVHPPPPPMPTDPINPLLIIRDYQEVWLRAVEADAQTALLSTALALRAYKMDHGAYPATLAALTPGYLRAVPDDPFALSGALRYKRLGAKYVLYSVGPDGKDDGGTAIFDRAKSAPGSADAGDLRYWVQQDSRGDIVAGINVS